MTENVLLMSPTLEKLCHFALEVPVDVRNPEELKAGFLAVTIDLIDAMDHGRIHFNLDEDAAAFMGILILAVDVAMDGRLKTVFKPVRTN